MKRIISVILALSLCAGVVIAFSSCGKKNKEIQAIEEAFTGVSIGGTLDENKLEEVSVAGSDEDSDNSVYNYVDGSETRGFIVNKEKGEAATVNFVIETVLYKDVDNDGYEEVYATGYNSNSDVTVVALFDYVNSMLPAVQGDKPLMTVVAYVQIPGEKHLTFAEKSDGVHVFEGEKDYGVISTNGEILQMSNYNDISGKDSEIDPSMFVTAKFLFYYNGKQLTPENDFAYDDNVANDLLVIEALDKAAFEKLTGKTFTSLGADIDSRSIMTINGKQYVSWQTLDRNYGISRHIDKDPEYDIYYVNFCDNEEDYNGYYVKEKEEYAETHGKTVTSKSAEGETTTAAQ